MPEPDKRIERGSADRRMVIDSSGYFARRRLRCLRRDGDADTASAFSRYLLFSMAAGTVADRTALIYQVLGLMDQSAWVELGHNCLLVWRRRQCRGCPKEKIMPGCTSGRACAESTGAPLCGYPGGRLVASEGFGKGIRGGKES